MSIAPRILFDRLWPWLFAVSGLAVVFQASLLSGFRDGVGDLGDSRLANFLFEHGYRWLRGDPLHADFWSPPMFYPHPNTAAYSDLLISAGPLYWPWRWLGLQPDLAFQLLILAACTLNFAVAYRLLRDGLVVGRLPASAGAFLIAFASPRLAHVVHIQLHLQFFGLLAVYALARLFAPSPPKGGRSWIVVFFGASVAQVYASFYLGWFLALLLAAACVWTLLIPPLLFRLLAVARAYPVTIVLSLASAAAACFPLATHYHAAALEVGVRSFVRDVDPLLPRSAHWVLPPPRSLLYAAVSRPPHVIPLEACMGIGWLTTLCCLAGLAVAIRDPRTRWPAVLLGLVLATGLFLVTDLSDWVGGLNPWWYVSTYVPGGVAIRVPSRIALLLVIPLGFGLAGFLQRLRRRWVAVVLALACAAEQATVVDGHDFAARRAWAGAVAASLPREALAYFYFPLDAEEDTIWLHIDGLDAQMISGLPTINGYSGNFPVAYLPYRRATPDVVGPEDVEEWLDWWCRKTGLPRENVYWIDRRPPGVRPASAVE